MKKEKVKELIDTDSGEIIELYQGDSFKIIREEQKDAIKKSIESKKLNGEIKEWNDHLGGFVFILFKYGDTLLKQYPEITSEDITKLFYLATYVDYNGNIINQGKILSRSSIRDILGLSINPFDIFYNKMLKFKIFIQDENRNIKINKECFAKGELDKEIDKYYNYTRMYIESIRYLFENVPKRKHKQLGNYFKIIPYIHRQRSILCWNPDSQDGLNLIRANELQEILGIHRNTIRAFINELVSVKLNNGESIIAFIKNDRDDKTLPIIVNPRVFYGGNFKDGKNEILKWFQQILK